MSLLQAQIDKFNDKFSHPEQVKKIALLAHEWTVDTGELTPSLKIKRKVIEAKYQKEIEGIYED
jgi:long-chain acyl-CoA synthetase